MPIYEYKCTKTCSEIVPVQRSIMVDDPGYKCKTCNAPMQQVYSDVGVVFNGSGYYSTDNRKK